jgi:hypothetical protein
MAARSKETSTQVGVIRGWGAEHLMPKAEQEVSYLLNRKAQVLGSYPGFCLMHQAISANSTAWPLLCTCRWRA